MPCDQLRDLMHEQTKIIKRHLDKHAWYHQMPDKNEALADFINIYGEIMREMYCDKVCPKHGDCEDYIRNLERQGIPLNRTQKIVIPEELERKVVS